jgi:anti-sigma factor RsiW
MAQDAQRLTADERANLVAYLDGELAEPIAQVIASKLTASPSARREVDSLRRTWDLLDHLSKPEVPPDFTSRTLHEAFEAAPSRRSVRLSRAVSVLRRLAGALLTLALVLATALAGYAATRWAWPDPAARLVRDLSLAEHLDAYRAVGSLDLLRQLDNLSEAELDRLSRSDP